MKFETQCLVHHLDDGGSYCITNCTTFKVPHWDAVFVGGTTPVRLGERTTLAECEELCREHRTAALEAQQQTQAA